jgi:hypothetical protein
MGNPGDSGGHIRLHGNMRYCGRWGYNPITAATTATCNGPDPLGLVDGMVDIGHRRSFDSESRSGVVLDDMTMNTID